MEIRASHSSPLLIASSLSDPINLYSRSEVLSNANLVPKERGLYAWFFKRTPALVPTEGLSNSHGATLLYVGISPKNEISKQNLQTRLRNHFAGNAEGSTLRLTLGVLLTSQSNFTLRRVGSGKTMTFTHPGEQWLDDWMEENAYVCWVTHREPWTVEKEVIQSLSLPLNIQHNGFHSFPQRLSDLRTKAKRQARDLPIVNEDNQRRTL